MGGVEDGQPPSKRMKSSLAESSRISTSSRAEEPVDTNSYRDLMARPIQCQGLEEVIGSKGVIKRIEFVRLIANSLYALGYKRSGECLEEESGISLHSSAVSLLIQHVLEGRWDESVSLLHKIGLEDEAIIKSAKFLILEQKFFELLSNGKTMDALKTLRAEISPLRINTSRIHELSFFILSCSQSQNGLHCKASLNVKLRSEVLDEVQKLLPPTVMAPERRLERLVEQALDLQRLSCIYHNSSDSNMSLYSDHHCGVENIPRHTLQILEGHHDEVWFLQFSNRGKYLASASNDRSAIIWEVGTDGEVSLKHRLCGHQRAVSQVAWSSDDQQLLTCGAEENVRRWDVETGECIQTYEKGGSLVVSCAWSPDGNSVFAGCSDKSICVWDVNGKEMECWRQKTLKISDLEITSGGKEIISMCRETALLILNRETKEEKLIEEDQAITSFSVSNDGKLVLVNLHNQEIHVWTIESSNIKLVSKYKGHKRSRFVIRSCFGGLEQSFIASGSEDSQVYIWHRSSGQLVGVLPGHSGVVNCVSWNPVNPHMLASASDDRTIRIWGLCGANIKHRASHSNGIQLCNGKVC